MCGAGVGAAWSRPFLSGTGASDGADPIGSEPESAPGPWASGAAAGVAQKSAGAATLASLEI